MARKPSIILNAQERKSAQDDLKLEIRNVKEDITRRKGDLKDAERDIKILNKTLTGLTVRLNALRPVRAAA